ncbi:unannotated protein [freshwater metagenome]|uniref:Unannotated protein n=1 Tax=freshwater metagenome TaxID=449393 RepID=A0A6J7BUJ3_9ZZZZ
MKALSGVMSATGVPATSFTMAARPSRICWDTGSPCGSSAVLDRVVRVVRVVRFVHPEPGRLAGV